MKISACLIVKNEEKNIEMCINSYKKIVDEIIVVDTGSEDNTVDIAKGLGAEIFFFKWINDFAAAKNYAIDRAKGDWIIFLDADEYFDADSIGKIKGVMEELIGTKYSAIGSKIINIDKVNDNIIDSFMQVRIFRNDKNIRYKSSIHEQLSKKNDKLHIISYYDDILIYHTGYSSNINVGKAKRNLEILLDNIQAKGENEDYYRYLCDCYFLIGDYDNALKYGELHLSGSIKIIGYESRMHKVVIDCMWKLGKPKQDIELKIKNTIDMFPDHPNFYCTYGFFLLDEKRYDEALNNFLLTLSTNKNYKGIEVNVTIGLIPHIHFKIGFIYEIKNSDEKALEHYYLSLIKNKFNKDVLYAAFRIIKKQKLEDIIVFINSIYNINYEKDVEFIIYELIKIKPKWVLSYYTNIWYKKFRHEDSTLTFTLLAEERFETAFKIFYNGYIKNYEESNAILAIVSSLLSDNMENIICLLQVVKPTYKRILKAYTGEITKFYETDIKDYITIFRELIIFNKDDVINKFLFLMNNFKVKIEDTIAKAFMDNCNYKAAIKYYNEYDVDLKNKNILMYVGYCNYKQGEYDNAHISIIKAIEKGYMENDANEFLKWIEEKRGDLE